MNDRIESLILSSLIKNEEYTRKVLPFLKEEYFVDNEQKIFSAIQQFVTKYNNLPTKEALLISFGKLKNLDEKTHTSIVGYITENLGESETNDLSWLLDSTENWCKKRAIYNAISKSIQIADGRDKEHDEGVIPDLLKEALAVGFCHDIGHDYFKDAGKQLEYYHEQESKIAFDIELLNTITRGGIKLKTLMVLLAGTNVGKSLALSHLAAGFLNNGKNVLYITLEMSDQQIRTRIDSNLLNIHMDDLENIPKDQYSSKVDKLRNKTNGNLVIKEYPEVSAHAGHFRHLIGELQLKKNFVPDVILIDYLNLALSYRLKLGAASNSYQYILSVAQEIKGLCKEFNLPIISATQTNRKGQNNTDLDYDDVSESHGLSTTADYLIGMSTSEELEKLNQIMFKQLKNRHNDKTKIKRFVVGIDRDHMRLYDVEQSAQENLADSGQDDDTPVFDKSQFGETVRKEKKDFSTLKFD